MKRKHKSHVEWKNILLNFDGVHAQCSEHRVQSSQLRLADWLPVQLLWQISIFVPGALRRFEVFSLLVSGTKKM